MGLNPVNDAAHKPEATEVLSELTNAYHPMRTLGLADPASKPFPPGLTHAQEARAIIKLVSNESDDCAAPKLVVGKKECRSFHAEAATPRSCDIFRWPKKSECRSSTYTNW